MNLIIWITVGGLSGALSFVILRLLKRSDQGELLLNIVVGMAGALLGGILLAPVFGTGAIDSQHYTNGKLIAAWAGALFLLSIVNLFGQLNKR